MMRLQGRARRRRCFTFRRMESILLCPTASLLILAIAALHWQLQVAGQEKFTCENSEIGCVCKDGATTLGGLPHIRCPVLLVEVPNGKAIPQTPIALVTREMDKTLPNCPNGPYDPVTFPKNGCMQCCSSFGQGCMAAGFVNEEKSGLFLSCSLDFGFRGGGPDTYNMQKNITTLADAEKCEHMEQWWDQQNQPSISLSNASTTISSNQTDHIVIHEEASESNTLVCGHCKKVGQNCIPKDFENFYTGPLPPDINPDLQDTEEDKDTIAPVSGATLIGTLVGAGVIALLALAVAIRRGHTVVHGKDEAPQEQPGSGMLEFLDAPLPASSAPPQQQRPASPSTRETTQVPEDERGDPMIEAKRDIASAYYDRRSPHSSGKPSHGVLQDSASSFSFAPGDLVTLENDAIAKNSSRSLQGSFSSRPATASMGPSTSCALRTLQNDAMAKNLARRSLPPGSAVSVGPNASLRTLQNDAIRKNLSRNSHHESVGDETSKNSARGQRHASLVPGTATSIPGRPPAELDAFHQDFTTKCLSRNMSERSCQPDTLHALRNDVLAKNLARGGSHHQRVDDIGKNSARGQRHDPLVPGTATSVRSQPPAKLEAFHQDITTKGLPRNMSERSCQPDALDTLRNDVLAKNLARGGSHHHHQSVDDIGKNSARGQRHDSQLPGAATSVPGRPPAELEAFHRDFAAKFLSRKTSERPGQPDALDAPHHDVLAKHSARDGCHPPGVYQRDHGHQKRPPSDHK